MLRCRARHVTSFWIVLSGVWPTQPQPLCPGDDFKPRFRPESNQMWWKLACTYIHRFMVITVNSVQPECVELYVVLWADSVPSTTTTPRTPVYMSLMVCDGHATTTVLPSYLHNLFGLNPPGFTFTFKPHGRRAYLEWLKVFTSTSINAPSYWFSKSGTKGSFWPNTSRDLCRKIYPPSLRTTHFHEPHTTSRNARVTQAASKSRYVSSVAYRINKVWTSLALRLCGVFFSFFFVLTLTLSWCLHT